MKGRWAAGIVPRNFAWVIKEHLAVAERPGGSAPAHRRVRRREEILWLRAQGFTKVVSLLPSLHNLHAYEELDVPFEHVPMGLHDDPTKALAELYPALLRWLYGGDRILVHQDEMSERLAGVLAGFLLWSRMVPDPPLAISAIEQLLRRQLGSVGRTIVTLAVEVPPPSNDDLRRPERAAAAALIAFGLGDLERAAQEEARHEADLAALRAEAAQSATKVAPARSAAQAKRPAPRAATLAPTLAAAKRRPPKAAPKPTTPRSRPARAIGERTAAKAAPSKVSGTKKVVAKKAVTKRPPAKKIVPKKAVSKRPSAKKVVAKKAVTPKPRASGAAAKKAAVEKKRAPSTARASGRDRAAKR